MRIFASDNMRHGITSRSVVVAIILAFEIANLENAVRVNYPQTKDLWALDVE